MGCRVSSAVQPTPTGLISQQSDLIKFKILDAIKRDDPLLLERLFKEHQISYQEKINDGMDTNWTVLHVAASRNSHKIIDSLLRTFLSFTVAAFDLVNARDLSGKTPLITAYDYSSFKAFEAILVNCTRFNHPVTIDKVFEKELPSGSQYAKLVYDYKFGNMNPSKENRKGTNVTKDEEKHLFVINTGSLENLKKQKDKIMKTPGIFKDKDFAHTTQNVFLNSGNESFSSTKSSGEKVKWYTLSKVFNENPYVILSKFHFDKAACKNAINPNLLYVFCALSRFPSRVKNIFLDSTINDKGLFTLTLFKNAVPTHLLLDDFFPFVKKTEELMFQRPFGDEVWPMLIEKGLAKLYGSYSVVTNLHIDELFESILGAPVQKISIKSFNKDILWLTLQDWDKNRYILLFSPKEERSNYLFMEGVYEYQSQRIIKLRKATPVLSIRKHLSETLMDEELKKLIGYEPDEDIIYIDVEEFYEEFENGFLCHYNEDWARSIVHIKTISSKNENFEFEVKRKGPVFLSFYQQENEKQVYSPLHFVLLSKDKSGYKTVAEGDHKSKDGARVSYIDDNLKVNLDKGKYIVQLKLFDKTKSVKSGTLMAYSEDMISFSSVGTKKILNEVFTSLGQANDIKEQSAPGCRYSSGIWGSYHWFYFENASDRVWEIEMKFEGMQNVKIGKPFKVSNDTIKVIVNKNEKQTAYLQKKALNEPSDFKLSMNHNFS